MTNRVPGILMITCSLLGITCRAQADIIRTDRTVDYDVTFSDSSAFSDAFANVKNIVTVGAGSVGTETAVLGYAALNTGITFFSTGAVSIVPGSAPAGAAEIETTVAVSGAGTYGFNEPVPVFNGRLSSVDYFPSPLARFAFNGLSTLEIFSPSNGELDEGGTWTTNISIVGDWSRPGNGDATGTHWLVDVDPLWTITNDFTYDSATNRTLFSVVNTSYPGVESFDNGPYPVILLSGQVTPEPRSAVLVALGILVSIAVVYGRKRASDGGQR